MVHTIYIVKLVFFFALGGVTVATATSGLPAFWHVAQWWNQPIVYQKVDPVDGAAGGDRGRRLVGPAGRQGQADDRRHPVLGPAGHHPAAAVEVGAVHRRRPAHLVRRRALPRAAGQRWSSPLLAPGVHSDSLSTALPDNTSGLVEPALLIAPIVLLVLIGLRDKTIFLAARGEQYLPALVIFAALPFVDMIVALKLLIVVVWVGAGLLEVRQALHQRDPADGQQQPVMPFKWLKRAHYRDFPRRPAPVPPRRLHGPRRRHHRRDRRAAGAAVLDQHVADRWPRRC